MSNRPDRQTVIRWTKICAITMAVLMLRVWENGSVAAPGAAAQVHARGSRPADL